MPEGPSILILKEEALIFKGKKVLTVHGNSKTDIQRLRHKKVTDLKTWGKQFFICFNDFSVRIHLMLFGSYRINSRKETPPRLSLTFRNGELNFYSCSVKLIEEDLDSLYDWERDTLSLLWNSRKAIASINKLPETPVCDLLLNQDIFAGAGNIIKNEVLYRLRMHPLSVPAALPAKKIKELATVTPEYCHDFYRWKKNFELKKHWLAYKQKTCRRCQVPICFLRLGKNLRYTYFCPNCQVLYQKNNIPKS